MAASARIRNCWPTKNQGLLLQAAFLSGTKAANAWEKWRCSVPLDRVDPASYRLLPLLYRNLQQLGINQPPFERLKGIYRHSWSRGQMLLHELTGILRLFNSAQIPVMPLKGAPLIREYYQDGGLRPMSDLDLLVKPADALSAMELLIQNGWQPQNSMPQSLIKNIQQHAAHFQHPVSGRELDLHWRTLHYCFWDGSDAAFWEDSHLLDWRGATSFSLSPADQLLHSCAHGVIWNRVPPLRWLADTLAIIKNSPTAIDWDRILKHAVDLRLTLAVQHTLNYLARNLDAPLPVGILTQLRRRGASPVEHLEYWAMSIRHRYIGRWTKLWLNHSRSYRDNRLGKRVRAFPAYVRQTFKTKNAWQIVFLKRRKS